MNAVPENYLSLADYFTLEETGEVKHEFYRGAIYALAGASATHNLIVANVIGELHAQLHGKPCKVYPSDLRLKIEATELYTYPDAQVICQQLRFADGRQDTVTNPTVIIEVLSPGTEDYDRGKKFQHYRAIPSLRDYLVIAQDSARAEHYIRQEAQEWLLIEITNSAQAIPLKSIDCTLKLAAIYEDVLFENA